MPEPQKQAKKAEKKCIAFDPCGIPNGNFCPHCVPQPESEGVEWEKEFDMLMAAALFSGVDVHKLAKISLTLKSFILNLLKSQAEQIRREALKPIQGFVDEQLQQQCYCSGMATCYVCEEFKAWRKMEKFLKAQHKITGKACNHLFGHIMKCRHCEHCGDKPESIVTTLEEDRKLLNGWGDVSNWCSSSCGEFHGVCPETVKKLLSAKERCVRAECAAELDPFIESEVNADFFKEMKSKILNNSSL